MIPLRDSMVDVQSPQQALQAYSSAKEYACGILCDARCGGSNRRAYSPFLHCERHALPGPAPPQRQHRHGSTSEPLASHTRYRSRSPTPCRDESRIGHNPISTLSSLPPLRELHKSITLRTPAPRRPRGPTSPTSPTATKSLKATQTVKAVKAPPPAAPPPEPRTARGRPAPRPASDADARRPPR